MIVYDLQCGAGHGFDGWFRDADAFEDQRRARKIVCPVCADTRVVKVPAAARIMKGRAGSHEARGADHGRAAAWRGALEALHEHVRETCDYVGARFPEEARRIHYGEAEERGIYGEATAEEARDLVEEGVPVARIPKLPAGDA